ncbi:hypothetical protein [Streptomyces sp. NPDC048200]|uniref:hypothetical protein n=1 Tax=Streptomyces sp. NPDC048200 TaxID=3365512 RepID=UPI00371C5134
MSDDAPDSNARTRTAKGQFAPGVDTARRDARAAELRAENWSLQDIADELGYHDKSHARQGIRRALRSIVKGPAEKLLAVYADRLEDIFQRTMEIAEAEHVMVSHGRVITDADGKPMRDHAPVLAAFREARSALADVRKMVGLDQPTRVDARFTEVSQQDLELQEMLREAKAAADLEEQEIRDGVGSDG